MKMSNKEMWESIQTLMGVEEKGKLGYACSRNLRKLMDACREYMEIRDRLLMENGEDQGGGKFRLSPEAAQKMSQELSQYEDIEHDVSIMTVTEEVFCGGSLTSKQMYALSWMVEEG